MNAVLQKYNLLMIILMNTAPGRLKLGALSLINNTLYEVFKVNFYTLFVQKQTLALNFVNNLENWAIRGH